MQFCTKTPTSQCGCRACQLDELHQEYRWLMEMSRSGAMGQLENASRIETCLQRMRTLEGRA